MELVMRGRNGRLPESFKRIAEQKLGRLEHVDPRLTRVEVEWLEEHNPRISDAHERVKAVARTSRLTFRARGAGPDVAAALDQVVARLDRQLTSYRSRFRARLIAGAHRLQSAARRTSGDEMTLP
ncbi:MAG TPA: ribosome-associated translation inhibitor RaiA [Actinomycetota bacterium]|nr:ribosome-associated translation inhibitor RaiA [Actinomycetota bacterium]